MGHKIGGAQARTGQAVIKERFADGALVPVQMKVNKLRYEDPKDHCD